MNGNGVGFSSVRPGASATCFIKKQSRYASHTKLITKWVISTCVVCRYPRWGNWKHGRARNNGMASGGASIRPARRRFNLPLCQLSIWYWRHGWLVSRVEYYRSDSMVVQYGLKMRHLRQYCHVDTVSKAIHVLLSSISEVVSIAARQ